MNAMVAGEQGDVQSCTYSRGRFCNEKTDIESCWIVQVCGGPGDTCSGGCGGAGCDFCGGLGCSGSISVSETALDRATQANDKFQNKKQQADDALEEVSWTRSTYDRKPLVCR